MDGQSAPMFVATTLTQAKHTKTDKISNYEVELDITCQNYNLYTQQPFIDAAKFQA